MRQPAPETVAGTTTAFPMPAPIGGWNARDSLAQMSITDAIYMDNFWPTLNSVQVRPGKSIYATLPVGRQIKSILSCAKQDGTWKEFAVAETGVYDLTAPTVLALALTNAGVESTNINVGGINYLWCCNGVDKPFVYKSDTGTFIPMDAVSVPALTGITSTDVTNVALWQNRIILCLKNSLAFYYLPLNSVGGAVSKFDLGQIFTRGGYLVQTIGWSVDAGNGPQNRLVCITSEGEIAVYSGTDPSSASSFSLVGIYTLGRPLSKRCLASIPGDIAILTESGLWPLTRIMASATIERQTALSDKIQNAFIPYAQQFGTQYGWQPVVFHGAPAILVNVPITSTISFQFVMNLLTKAWTRFTNWDATCYTVSNGKLLFGMGNYVFRGWTGKQDIRGAITARAKQAFTYGPSRARQKQITLLRPVINAEGDIGVSLALDMDFDQLSTYSSISTYNQQLALFDSARYNTARWSSGNTTIARWKTVTHHPGFAFSIRIQIQANGVAAGWASTDALAQVGSSF